MYAIINCQDLKNNHFHHLSLALRWHLFVAIANIHEPRPADSADINTRLQLSDTNFVPAMHDGFLL